MATKENQIPFRQYDPLKFLTSPQYGALDAHGKSFEFISGIFAEALNAGGWNVSNPETANMFYYNKMMKRDNVEPPRVGRTYVFFTRPDCCWSLSNISVAPEIEYLWHTPLGKQLMCMLTTPGRYVGGSNMQTHEVSKYILSKETKAVKKLRQQMIDNSDKEEETLEKFSADTYKELYEFYDRDVAEAYRKRFDVDIVDEKGNINVGESKNYYRPEHNYEHVMEGTTIFANKIPGLEGQGYFNSRFMPLFSNTCIEAPCGRDLSLETIETAKDFFNNSLVYATDSDEVNAPTEITFSFENTANNSVWLSIFLWVSYIRYVARGRFYARYSDVVNRIIDYTSSFFVFVTDVDGITLKGWARGMGCYPLNVPMQGISHSREPNLDAWRNLAIPFKVNKYRTMDPQDLMDFNYFSTQEWLQKPKYDDSYYTIDKMAKKSTVLGKDYYKAVSYAERGISGKLPPFMLTSSGVFGDSNIHKYNNTWGGYPYIADGCKLVWIDPDDFKDIAFMGDTSTKRRF